MGAKEDTILWNMQPRQLSEEEERYHSTTPMGDILINSSLEYQEGAFLPVYFQPSCHYIHWRN